MGNVPRRHGRRTRSGTGDLVAGNVFRRRARHAGARQAKPWKIIALFGDTRRFILNAGCAIPAGARQLRPRHGARGPVVASGRPRSASRRMAANTVRLGGVGCAA
jgi:hypothetical protein